MPSRRRRGPGHKGLPADFAPFGFSPWVKPMFRGEAMDYTSSSDSDSSSGSAEKLVFE